MSWAGPEDVYLSTSLASYLDSKFLFFAFLFLRKMKFNGCLMVRISGDFWLYRVLFLFLPNFAFGLIRVKSGSC